MRGILSALSIPWSKQIENTIKVTESRALEASRTFAHQTLAQDWYFIDACQLQVKRPF